MRPRIALSRLSRPASLALLAALAACGGGQRGGVPWGQGAYKVGEAYEINGRRYQPRYEPAYDKVGTASWYGDAFDGLATANGERFDKGRVSAAHPTLPLPSIVRVTNLDNGRTLDVRVNDRGPFVGDRLIDLSEAAARRLGFEEAGLANVRVTFMGLADARGDRPAPDVPAGPVMVAVREPEPVRPATTPRLVPSLPLPVVASAPMPAATVAQRDLAPPASSATVPPRPLVVADAGTASARAFAACAAPVAGPRFIQVGTVSDGGRIRALSQGLAGVGAVVVEPYFAGGQALARVKVGPVPDAGEASRLLARVRGLGYPEAFVGPSAPC